MVARKKVVAKSKVVSPLRVGNAVLIRTVTMAYTGKIVGLTATEILLADAAWIADTGRYSTSLATGFPQQAEIEPYPDKAVVSVNRGGLIDAVDWQHGLPRTVQ
jgi:hypothetical protein